MQRTGVVNLPLHPGKCPKWLFPRMARLGKEITAFIVFEFGQEEFLSRIANPFFFQSLGCILGFDWHSSGLTTTVTAALKKSINEHSQELGLFCAGGKGSASKKTLEDIETAVENFNLSSKKEQELKKASRLSAKVDNSMVQDGFQLYHHSFFISENGSWSVVQQGLNENSLYARRYHWLSFKVESFVEEPHSGIHSKILLENVMDLTSKESRENRAVSLDLARENPFHLKGIFNRFFENQKTLGDFSSKEESRLRSSLRCGFTMQSNHLIPKMIEKDYETLKRVYEIQPKDYESFLMIKGIGPKTIRALALISQLVYGAETSWQDPAKFSYAHGGKDKIPYPVDKEMMDDNTKLLREALKQAKLGDFEKRDALRRLSFVY
ncbi:MAG: DUF763 domain-containing protein [Candidatus Woesearchaeota archaeon]